MKRSIGLRKKLFRLVRNMFSWIKFCHVFFMLLLLSIVFVFKGGFGIAIS
jgi:hypothetical protein